MLKINLDYQFLLVKFPIIFPLIYAFILYSFPSLETALGEFVLGSESNALMTAGGNNIYRKYLKYKYKYIKLKRRIKNKKNK